MVVEKRGRKNGMRNARRKGAVSLNRRKTAADSKIDFAGEDRAPM